MVLSVGKTIGIVLGSFFGESSIFANPDAVRMLIYIGIQCRLDTCTEGFLILFVIYLRIALGIFEHTFDGWYRALSRLGSYRWRRVNVSDVGSSGNDDTSPTSHLHHSLSHMMDHHRTVNQRAGSHKRQLAIHHSSQR